MIELMKEYRKTSDYGERILNGEREYHKGQDFVKIGNDKSIKAFIEGKVVFAGLGVSGTGVGGYGNLVVIKDKYGHLQLYCHMKDGSIVVSKGQYVKAGQKIGEQGHTGQSFGDHLHFEIRKCGDETKPYGYRSGMKEEDWTLDPIPYVDWYYSQEPKVTQKPVVTKPVDTITPKELIKLISSKYFKDIPEELSWVKDPADRLYELGIIKGAGNSQLNPEEPMTRAEAIVLIDRMVSLFDTRYQKK